MAIKLTSTKIWPRLSDHSLWLKEHFLADLYRADKNRFKYFSREAAGIYFDFSKQKITEETLDLLFSLAYEQELPKHFHELFSGEFINKSEQRQAFHTALRAPFSSDNKFGEDIKKSLEKMKAIVESLHTHTWTGFSGQSITDVVNLGIGGSYHGPAMGCEALWNFQKSTISGQPLKIHFIANVDKNAFEKCLRTLNPATTLFLVSSKSFKTSETMINYARAKEWIFNASKKENAFSHHFIAITANPDEAIAQGFSLERIIPFWDWVGGRYSLWSAIGLPIAISLGMENFEQFLIGAHDMDKHVSEAPPEENLAIILALLDIWQINFNNVNNHLILAYHHDLHLFPTYLQQLIMESNGKNRDQDGNLLDYKTAPIVWGGVGTLAQHSYHQFLHQGSSDSIMDFILVARDPTSFALRKEMISHCLSQTNLLLHGKLDNLSPHKELPGNRPHNTIWSETLTPRSLGALIALYEHRIFAQAMLWNINPFDQWGVEHSKTLQVSIESNLDAITEDKNLEELISFLLHLQ